MPQYVFEFGSERLNAVVQALDALMGTPSSIEVLRADQAASLNYESASTTVSTVMEELERGTICSAIFRNRSSDVRYGLIVAPGFNGQQLSLWMGTLEITTSEWQSFWMVLLRCAELRFACLGRDEGVELTDDQLSVETFPWRDWPLVVGAIRKPSGEWFVMENAVQMPPQGLCGT